MAQKGPRKKRTEKRPGTPHVESQEKNPWCTENMGIRQGPCIFKIGRKPSGQSMLRRIETGKKKRTENPKCPGEEKKSPREE